MTANDFNTRYFFFLLLGVGVFVALLLWPFLSAIVAAGTLAVLFQPAYRWCMRKTRGKRGVSAGAVCLLILLIIVLPMVLLSGLVVSEIKNTYTNHFSEEGALARDVEMTKRFLSSIGFSGAEEFLSREKVLEKFGQASSFILNIAQTVYIGTTQFIFWLFVMFFTLFYFLVDGKNLMVHLMHLSPLRRKQEQMLMDSFGSMGRAILKGTLLIAIFQGFLGALFLVLAGFSSPFLWGSVITLLSIVPFLGPAAVLFPAGIWLFIGGDMIGGGILLFGGTFASTVDNFLRPKLVGRDTAVHPLLIFFSTLGGLSLFGVMGFLIGPIIMALFLSLLVIYEREFSEQLKEYNR